MIGPPCTPDFYAATNGMPSGVGSYADPWDPQTALNQPAGLLPGMTLGLKGGTYVGSFFSAIEGTAGNLITVRSAPGEWAVFDGYVVGVLASNISAGAATLTLVDGSGFPTSFPLGFQKMFINADDEGAMITRTGNVLTIVNFGAHLAGELVTLGGSALQVDGEYVHFRDFESKNTNPIRDLDLFADFLTPAVTFFAPNSIISNVLGHDSQKGLGFWSLAANSIADGNLFYNNSYGEIPPAAGGHGIYTQNTSGTKLIKDNILFGNNDTGIHMYVTAGDPQVGFTIEGNVAIGTKSTFLFGGHVDVVDVQVLDNLLYGASFQFGYADNVFTSAVATGNYVFAVTPIYATGYAAIVITENRFYMMPFDTGKVMRIDLAVGQDIDDYTFGDNDYLSYHNAANPGSSFQYKEGAGSVTFQTWAQWQTYTSDSTSTFQGSVTPRIVPTGVDIFYRPNTYEVGRGNIIIYNYDQVASVALDLSEVGLEVGATYRIINGQNPLAVEVVSGSYAGGTVSVPLDGLTVAQRDPPNGTPNPETPDFAVLVVLPTYEDPPPPPVYDVAPWMLVPRRRRR